MADIVPSRGDNPTQHEAAPLGPPVRGGGAPPGGLTDGSGTTVSGALTDGQAATAAGAPRAGAPRAGAEFRIGEVLAGRFEITGIVGRGGMAVVYEAYDRLIKETVALKAMLPEMMGDARTRRRFIREVNLARRLRHPGIVIVLDLLHHEGVLFYTMEFLRGQTLRALLAEREWLVLDEAAPILTAVSDALEHAHHVTIHRDISPENIVILLDGTVKLLDFGIARPLDTQVSRTTGRATGKAYYMAPEQRAEGAAPDVRADLWSLGVCFFEMLAGSVPMGFEKLTSHRPELPPACDEIVSHTVVPIERRYASVRQFREALDACARPKKQASEGRAGWLTKKRVFAACAAVAIIALALVPLLLQKRPEATGGQAALPAAGGEAAPGPQASAAAPAASAAIAQAEAWDFSGYWQGGAITNMRLERVGRGFTGWFMWTNRPQYKNSFEQGSFRGREDGMIEATCKCDVYQHNNVTIIFDPATGTADFSTQNEHSIQAQTHHRLQRTRTLAGEQIIETETLSASIFPGDKPRRVASHGGAKGFRITTNYPNTWLEIPVEIDKAGSRQVGVVLGFDDFGAKCQVAIDGTPIGSPIDTEYNGHNEGVSDIIWLGQHDFTAGTHKFWFLVLDPEESFLYSHDDTNRRMKRIFVDQIVFRG
ncbi:MAG: serine/threonine protein kinase [Candidatus Hydrogenedentes bacterium]|nr:serine/threonine protein kinase [Candidatus Hydrogenedentota bacterium]